ncbi:MAG: hypothetical protein QNJ40_21015 [Xanthomonadales bacterium]|nr:hypothetical protein [Xanthomonadales bacterium]
MLQSTSQQIDKLILEFDRIDDGRKQLLAGIAEYVGVRVNRDETARLTLICTHNSRRSQMSQIWAQAAAAYWGVRPFQAYSGGTEVTAFHPNAIRAMREAGFEISGDGNQANPHYAVSGDGWAQPLTVYSKIFDQPPNPTGDYAAVMTCGHADTNCPYIFGCDARFTLPYEDPKAFDGMDIEQAGYGRRARQIGREMLFLFSQVTAAT